MRIKLDENFGRNVANQLSDAGYEVSTVFDENLQGGSDDDVMEASRVEHRCLVTLDLGFANVLRYRPSAYAGIVVVRLSAYSTAKDIGTRIETLIRGLAIEEVKGRPWIVEANRIRKHVEDDDD